MLSERNRNVAATAAAADPAAATAAAASCGRGLRPGLLPAPPPWRHALTWRRRAKREHPLAVLKTALLPHQI
eukprot:11036287-Lingulodinium_polyedra.AAC.1